MDFQAPFLCRESFDCPSSFFVCLIWGTLTGLCTSPSLLLLSIYSLIFQCLNTYYLSWKGRLQYVGVNVDQDYVPSRPAILCFHVRMEDIWSANKIGSEVVSDLDSHINKWLWSWATGSPIDSSCMMMPSLSPMSVS